MIISVAVYIGMIESQTPYVSYIWVQVAWLVGAAIWFWRKNDELPLVISGFNFYVFSFRCWALVEQWASPVSISQFGFAPLSATLCAEALGVAVLGQSLLLVAYMLTQRRKLVVRSLVAPPRLVVWLRARIFLFGVMAILMALIARRSTSTQLQGGKSMAFEVSAYLYELPLVLISLALLLALLWRFGGLPGAHRKIVAFLTICLVAYLTFGPVGRFQFLGWLLAVTIIATTGLSRNRRLTVMALGFSVTLAVFGLAGALRNADETTDLRRGTWERLFLAEDANMLDGLALLRQVYPNRLPYSYGGEHLEIIERPIPRALWPGKPVGGYMNKLGLTTAATGFTLGISPGLVGSFYAEGGVYAVVLLSALYGHVLGRIVRYSTRVTPMAGVLIRAICCASLIPLLRGGDLPGIYAWIFMAFWPCFLFLWLRRRNLFPRRARRRRWKVTPQILAPMHPSTPDRLPST